MPWTPCEYKLFGKECRATSLRDAMRHLLHELYERYPEALVQAAKGQNLTWLQLWSSHPARDVPVYFWPPEGLNRYTLRRWSSELLMEMWLSPRVFQITRLR